jgi:phospholipid-binding lipoprotein MlaA
VKLFEAVIAVGFVAGCLGCGASSVKSVEGPRWAIIEAPSLAFFPDGDWATPRSEWNALSTYSSEDDCRAAMERERTARQPHIFDCIASDDPDYAQGAGARMEAETANQAVHSDPLAPFNEAMFKFNLKLDEKVVRPISAEYAAIAPKPVRVSVGNFLDNASVIPRVANNLFQLRVAQAGEEVARFGINTTLGVAGLFDPADSWFGMKEHHDDFGLTLRYYGVPTGPYLMLPILGPSTVGDAVGIVADQAMNPMKYFLPWYINLPVSAGKRGAEAINYRSMRMDQFEEADLYAVDLYGAVQDAYIETREHKTKELKKN